MKSWNPVKLALTGCFFAVLSLPQTRAATQVWIGPGAGSNAWSTGASWTNLTANTTGTAPASTDDVKFFDTGTTGTASNVDNLVDSGFGGTIASLQYGNTNNFHTTVISNGLTLNLTGAGGLTVFTPGDQLATVRTLRATIVGTGAALNLNNAAANLLCNQGSGTASGDSATLDMTGLDAFTGSFNAIGLGSAKFTGSASSQLAGILYLAKTNTITLAQTATLAAYAGTPGTANSQATAIDISYNTGNPPKVLSSLYLGLTNVFYVDSIRSGGDKASATSAAIIAFNPAFTNNNPYAYFRGAGGTANSLIKWWTIGDMGAGASGSNTSVSTNDFSNGTVDILVDTLSLGRDCVGAENAGAAVPIQGVLTFTAGTINANTIYAGNQLLNITNVGSSPIVGIINVNGPGASLVVNSNLVLGRATIVSPKSTGVLNIRGGTVLASNLTVGATSLTNTVTMNSGTLIVSNALATAVSPLITFATTNGVLGLTLTADSATKAFVTGLTTGGAANQILLATNPVVFFGSYPATIHLFKYSTWTGVNNFGLTNLPGWATGATLVSNSANGSLDLVIPTDPRPLITGGPAAFSGTPGTNFTLSVTNTGVAPFGYQWYYTNGTSTNALTDGAGPGITSTLSGSTTSNLFVTTASTGDSGGYFAVITNVYGAVTSSLVQVTISSSAVPPGVTGPATQTVIAGQNATLSDGTSGSPVPSLQWQFNGVNISDGPTGNGDGYAGTTTASLIVTNTQYPASQGAYSLIASNSAGLATNSTVLTVIVAPLIAVQPVSLVATTGQSATFTVTSTNGVPAPTFQWKKGNSVISGATASSYTIGSVAATDTATNYSVTVSNAAGVVTSSSVALTVNSAMSALTLVPANGAAGVCYDTPLRVAFSAAPLTRNAGTIKIYNVTNSSTPVDTLDMSVNSVLTQIGTGIASYTVNVQSRTIAGASYTTFPVIITGNTAAIYPHEGVMTSNQTYYVTIDGGVFTDTTGAYFAGITATNAWQFSTKTAGPPAGTNYVVVATDGTADFSTIQGAVDFFPALTTTVSSNRVIFLRKGNSVEIVRVPVGKNNITIRGESRQESLLSYPNSNIINPSSHQVMVLHVLANDIAIENLKLTNSVPQGGSQSFALMVETGAKRFICNNADVDSYQDTILVNTSDSTAYFYKSLIQGDVDFIWGGGNCFFTNCEVRELRTGGIFLQPRTTIGSNGMSFVKCNLTRLNGTNASGSNFTNCLFARALGNTNSNAALIYCNIDTNVVQTGWTAADINDVGLAERWWEYGNSNLDGTAPAVYNGIQLTSGDPRLAAATNSTVWLNGWVPQLVPNILSQPTNQTVNAGGSATFTVSATGIPDASYQWLKNGTNLSGQTGSSLTINNASASDIGAYSVIVSNVVGSVTSGSANLNVHSPATGPTLSNAAVLANGNVQFSINGPSGSAGFGYRVWATTNVALTPVTNTWTLLTNDIFGPTPTLFTDPTATGLPQRYYLITVP